MRTKIILLLIFILSFILSFYKLGQYPVSLDWDEVSLGYNAYSILLTQNDEYGNYMPLQFRSFGDYKPPLYVYLAVPFVKVLGLTDVAVRLPSAVAGFLTVVIVYLLIKELFPELSNKYVLLGTYLFTVSPWHLQFTRVAFEANMGLFWLVLGTYLFIKALNNKLFLSFSAVAFVLSIYSYHSLRLIAPMIVIGLTIIYFKNLWKIKGTVFLSAIFGILLLIPIFLLLSEGVAARFSSVSNITPETLAPSIKRLEYDIFRGDQLGVLLNNRRIVYLFNIVKGYFDHWNPSFLFLTGDPPERHHAPDMGMLYLIELPFVLAGFYSLFFDFRNKGKYVLLLWFFIAPLASSLTTGTPHAVRALFYLPTYQIIAMIGIRKLYVLNIFATYALKTKLLTVGIVFLYIISIYHYLDSYYILSPIKQAKDWQYGYKEVVKSVDQIKKSDESVIATYRYDQPHVYFLFYNKVDPSWYQRKWQGGDIKRFNRSFGDNIFRNINYEEDKNLVNTILVGTPDEIPPDSKGLVKEIFFPNGDVAFRIVRN